MGDPGKSLTVSYGPFSCRLEGYHDAAEAVWTVAAVFGDLARLAPDAAGQDTGAAEGMAGAADGLWHGAAGGTAADGGPGSGAGATVRDGTGAAPPEVTPCDPAAGAEAAPPPTDPAGPPPAGLAATPPDPAVLPLAGAAAPPDVAVDRLLLRAEDALAGDDARQRHSLLGHLKAAVAATRAGDAAGTPAPGASPMMEARFRADLAAAMARWAGPGRDAPAAGVDANTATPGGLRAGGGVEPGRVPPGPPFPGAPPDGADAVAQEAGGAVGPARPTEARRSPAPVPRAKARADGEGPGSGTDRPPAPASPRLAGDAPRPARAAGTGAPAGAAPASGDDSAPRPPGADFAGFAAQRGAQGLREVLEAAAAFATEVEGCRSFSRQQVLGRAEAMHPDAATRREAGLRAFGAMLREGRIVRTSGGLFALATHPGGP